MSSSGSEMSFLCMSRMKLTVRSSRVASGTSLMGKMRSNRLMRVGERLIWLATVSYGSNRPNFGLAAARTVVSHLRLA